MLVLIGPPRSGKGTISRVLEHLVGKANVVGPSLNSLGGQFGLQPLLGKSLAIIPDARLSGKENPDLLTERLLAITGEDVQTVPRKFLEPVTTRLPTRLMLVSNELPKLPDASKAIVAPQSWLDREDYNLIDRLLRELPGILHWAIAGLERLRQRGRFLQPASAKDLLDNLQGLASPVASFVEERCDKGPDHYVMCDQLFKAWTDWCRDNGQPAGAAATLGKSLRAALPTVMTIKKRVEGKERRVYTGLALRSEDSRDACDAELSMHVA
jgi:putative DNA primase/helicase